jgi:hypothetical protein
MPQSHKSGASSELRLLQTLIDRCKGSLISPVEVEKGLENGLARVMLLEGRLREQASRATAPRPGEDLSEDYHLVEEIRALRTAVADLRARTSPGGSAPLAQGFVLRRAR